MTRLITTSRVLTVVAVFLAILAPFFFPWPYAFAVGVLASFFFPPGIILTGTLIDTLYFSATFIPYFTILGFCIGTGLYFVQQFIKTRIMS